MKLLRFIITIFTIMPVAIIDVFRIIIFGHDLNTDAFYIVKLLKWVDN